MENVTKLLDAVKQRSGIESDYALAQTLEVRKQRVSDYYKGNRTPDSFTCLKIAELLGKPLAEVIAAVELDAEKDEKRRSTWNRYYKSIGGTAASFMIAAFALVTLIVTNPAEAKQSEGLQSGARQEYQLCEL